MGGQGELWGSDGGEADSSICTGSFGVVGCGVATASVPGMAPGMVTALRAYARGGFPEGGSER